jgi:hypothetical protein
VHESCSHSPAEPCPAGGISADGGLAHLTDLLGISAAVRKPSGAVADGELTAGASLATSSFGTRYPSCLPSLRFILLCSSWRIAHPFLSSIRKIKLGS